MSMTLNVSIGSSVRVIAGLLIASTKAVLALDRMAFSFFTVAMASEFDWSTADQGRVKAAFSFGSVFAFHSLNPNTAIGASPVLKHFVAYSLLVLGICGPKSLVGS